MGYRKYLNVAHERRSEELDDYDGCEHNESQADVVGVSEEELNVAVALAESFAIGAARASTPVLKATPES